MPGAVETVINRHIVGFHEIPVAIEQAFFCRLVPDLVQGRLVHLTESDIRVVKHGKRYIRFTLAADDLVSVFVLHEAGTHPVNRRIGGEQHSRGLECLMGSPAETGRTVLRRPRSEISDTLIHHAMVYSEEPKRSKLGSLGISAISFMMMTESFQNVSVPSRLFIL
mgnify:CR=1 FL=1